MPKWRNGRRGGLKNRWGQPHPSSTLGFGTTYQARIYPIDVLHLSTAPPCRCFDRHFDRHLFFYWCTLLVFDTPQGVKPVDDRHPPLYIRCGRSGDNLIEITSGTNTHLTAVLVHIRGYSLEGSNCPQAFAPFSLATKLCTSTITNKQR